jgi:hypothetical protein
LEVTQEGLDYEAAFRYWFVEYFLPEMKKKYCAGENLDFNILLILDDARAHVFDYVSLSENGKVIYKPLRQWCIYGPWGPARIPFLGPCSFTLSVRNYDRAKF